MPRHLSLSLLALPARVIGAVAAAGDVLDREQADVVVGFGGYVAFAAYLAARRRKLPIVVHEANARPGLANKVGARLTTYVAVSQADCGLPHGTVIGIPLRSAITSLDRGAARGAARNALGLDPGAPVLLVTGGSQGAKRINEAVVDAADALAGAGVQVLHLAGVAHAGQIAAAVAQHPGHLVLPYLDRMEDAYAAADLVLGRAGAMTCAELAAVGLPAFYVPLPIGNGEQRLNALPTVDAGGGVLVADQDLTADVVRGDVLALLKNPTRLATMSRAAGGTAPSDAAGALVAMLLAATGRIGP
jgi:UDP-N-acetylglucosamine--N-acetylmuramyl-(pentapeptide) pyrophosphoryl-undecaprenol N-acetylglucosamine transferase